MVLQAFIDESQSEEEFVLAGHIATDVAWAKFSVEWETLLPTALKDEKGYYFKMSEMAHAGRIDRVEAFYRVIEENVTASISVRLNIPEFRRALKEVKEKFLRMNVTINFKRFENPYWFSFFMMMNGFHIHRELPQDRLPLDQPVDFYFDDRTEKTPILAAWDSQLDLFELEIRNRFGGTPRFENDRLFLPLQGADLWAWWMRKWYEEDTDHLPEGFQKMNFGKWGSKKKRGYLTLSYNDKNTADALTEIAVENIARETSDTSPIRAS